MALFTTKDIAASTPISDDFIESDDSLDFVICKNPDKLNRLIQAIELGKTVHYLSDGDWSMHDLVIELLKKYNPAELFITTYALREHSVRQILLAQQSGHIKSVCMILDYRAKVRTPEVFQLASLNFNKIFLYGIHAKVTILKSPVGYITIIGSANWTSNPRVECGVITMDPRAAEFHISWINKISEHAEIFG